MTRRKDKKLRMTFLPRRGFLVYAPFSALISSGYHKTLDLAFKAAYNHNWIDSEGMVK